MLNIPRPRARAVYAMVFTLILVLASTAMPVVSSGGTNGSTSWEISHHKTKLPYAVYRAASVWTGEKEYLISGRTDQAQVDTIIEFDPDNGKAVVKDARVPKARIMAAAAWFPPYAYIFGGQNLSTILDDVLRYDPAADKVEAMTYKMPFPRVGSTAVSVGDSILVMGGRNESDYVSSVLRFYPGNGTFLKLQPTPIKGGGRTGVYTGETVYLFGSCVNVKNQAVMEINPKTGTSKLIDIGQERGFYWSNSVWTGQTALIFGGNDYNTTMDQFLEFSPGSGGSGKLKDIGRLPEPIENSAAFYDTKTSKAYLLGGRSTTKGVSDIYTIAPSGPAPVEVNSERALLVGALMVFVLAVVALQSHFQHPDRDAGEGDPHTPKPIHPAKPCKDQKKTGKP